MNYRLNTLLAVLVILGAGCRPSDLASGIEGIAKLDALCVTGYSVTIKPPAAAGGTETIDFAAVLANPNAESAQGSVQLLMGVDGANLPGVTSNISAQSQVPSFKTPVSTVYPANSSSAYTSPTLVSLPYSPDADYTIEIHKWLIGQDSFDATPCHNYKITKKFPRP